MKPRMRARRRDLNAMPFGCGVSASTSRRRGPRARPANRSGVVALEADGTIPAAGWTIGLDGAVDWIDANARADALAFVDRG